MGEAIISRSGGASGGNGGSGTPRLVTEIITSNTYWTVPNAVNNQFSIRIFGGGAGAEEDTGGCSGYMNNDILQLSSGASISILIGSGGNGYSGKLTNTTMSKVIPQTNGGTTSFGTYLSALGGNLKCGGAGGGVGYRSGNDMDAGIGYQFGGGGGYYGGGRGGKWGGGGGFKGNGTSKYNIIRGGVINNKLSDLSGLAGNSAGTSGSIQNNINHPNFISAEDGTNTIGYTNIFDGVNVVDISEDMCSGNLQGAGYSGTTYNISNSFYFGGGGGYGGNGGSGAGGGGGYGARGGNNFGGGGGYGGDGGYGILDLTNIKRCGGGGGGYGKGGNAYYNDDDTVDIIAEDGGYGAGGGSTSIKTGKNCSYNFHCGNGGNGICIIQYFVSE